MPRRSSTPTMKEIARRANVSVGTVSRVLNRHQDVDEELRNRVEAVVRKVGYRLTARTRSVVQTKAKIIGLIACGEANHDAELAPLLLGVEEFCSQSGYCLLFSRQNGHFAASDPLLSPVMQTPGLADCVIVSGPFDEQFLSMLDRWHLRYVLLANEAATPPEILRGRNTVQYDEARACIEAVQYLAKLGHSDIWFIGDDLKPSHRNRLTAYMRAIAALRLEPHIHTVAVSEDESENGHQAVSFIIEQGWPMTAIVAASEELAFGAREGLRQHRREIPKDVSLIGFEWASRPSRASNVTSVSIDMVEIGRQLAKSAIEQIEEDAGESRQISIPVPLIKRSTCRPLRREEHMML